MPHQDQGLYTQPRFQIMRDAIRTYKVLHSTLKPTRTLLRVQGRLPPQFLYRLDIHGILAIVLNRPIQVGDAGQGNGGRWRQLEGIRLCDRWWRCVLPFFLIPVPLREALRVSSLPHLSLLLKKTIPTRLCLCNDPCIIFSQ